MSHVVAITVTRGLVVLAPELDTVEKVIERVRELHEQAGSLTGSASQQPPPGDDVWLPTLNGRPVRYSDIRKLTVNETF